MLYPAATDAEVALAQAPHNLFVSGLFLFDLLMAPAVVALEIGMAALLIPLLCSGTLVAYIWMRSRKTTSWFVDAHWRLACLHGLWLLAGYAMTAVLVLVAWLVSLGARDANMEQIMWTALTRIALMPSLILVMITAVLEASAIPLAAKREVPDKLAAKFPPPDPVS